MKKILAILFCVLNSIFCYSQEVEMADAMRSSGKIYVVVGVLVTIFLGIIAFLLMIDRKVSDLEKKIGRK